MIRTSTLLLPSSARSSSLDIESRILLSAGFVGEGPKGIIYVAPCGTRVLLRIAKLARTKLARLGAQEMSFPLIRPGIAAGRPEFSERISKGLNFIDQESRLWTLSSSHEHEVAIIAAGGLTSHRQLPQHWYHLQHGVNAEVPIGQIMGEEQLLDQYFVVRNLARSPEPSDDPVSACAAEIARQTGVECSWLSPNESEGGFSSSGTTRELSATIMLDGCQHKILLGHYRLISKDVLEHAGLRVTDETGHQFVPTISFCRLRIQPLVAAALIQNVRPDGPVLPETISPFLVCFRDNNGDVAGSPSSERFLECCQAAGIDVLWDDATDADALNLKRAAQLGVRFSVISDIRGACEITDRLRSEVFRMPLESAVEFLRNVIYRNVNANASLS